MEKEVRNKIERLQKEFNNYTGLNVGFEIFERVYDDHQDDDEYGLDYILSDKNGWIDWANECLFEEICCAIGTNNDIEFYQGDYVRFHFFSIKDNDGKEVWCKVEFNDGCQVDSSVFDYGWYELLDDEDFRCWIYEIVKEDFELYYYLDELKGLEEKTEKSICNAICDSIVNKTKAFKEAWNYVCEADDALDDIAEEPLEEEEKEIVKELYDLRMKMETYLIKKGVIV